MTKFEKILVVGILFCGLIIKLIDNLEIDSQTIHYIPFILTLIGLTVLEGHYLTKPSKKTYLIIFVLLILTSIGSLAVLFHRPFLEVILLFVWGSNNLIISGVLVKTGFELRKEKKKDVIYNFIISGALITNHFLSFTGNIEFLKYFNIIIIASILTMMYKGINLRLEESRILTIVMILSFLEL